MRLKDILKGVALKEGSLPIPEMEVGSVTDDSRTVKPGSLFIAVKGEASDGFAFIGKAIASGARAIVSQRDFDSRRGVAKILVHDVRAALAAIADNFYGHPSRALKTIGVTGTNGKTTVTYLIESIIKAAAGGVGVIGTVNYRIAGRTCPARNTTPGALELEWLLDRMVREGLEYAVMEVSSHALDQKRVDGILFDVAVFTNLTSEHLDYHKTIGEYFRAKARIFGMLKPHCGTAVLNTDSNRVSSLKASLESKVFTFGIRKDADVMARRLRLTLEGSEFTVITPKTSFEVATALPGLHNVSNILAATAAALKLGIGVSAIKKGIESLRFVPGRLEPVETGQPFKVLVDYAHTQDALFNVLSVMRQLAKARIITVFGCGGNRDRKKRPAMGRTSCEFSDKVIITSDNPRFEEPMDIIAEIEKGVRKDFSNYTIVEERHMAIEKALGMAESGDIVVIAGKGHEDYQIIKDKVIHFDDREVAMEILKKQYAGKGPVKDNAGTALLRRA